MSDTESSRADDDEQEESERTGSQERPTKQLFTMLEDEAGGITPEPSNLTNFTREFVYSEISPKDYHSSNFPSLMSHLGPKTMHRTNRGRKKNTSASIYSNLSRKTSGKNNSLPTDDGHTGQQSDKYDFGAQMRRKNEATWNRIEAVAKEKMEFYDRYVAEMTQKLKQQRARINRRSTELLKSLEQQEERKKEERMFQSPYGRIWRHHRTMQRRAFSLEPMRSHNITLASVK